MRGHLFELRRGELYSRNCCLTMSTALAPCEPIPKLRHGPVESLHQPTLKISYLSYSLPVRTLSPLAVPMLTRQTEHRGRGFLQFGHDCSFT